MVVNIIDIATSVLRAVSNALQSMYNIQLTELPRIYKEPVFSTELHASADDYVSVIKLKHPPTYSTGFITLFITKDMATKLLEASGLGVEFKPQEIADSCGELCNLVAGDFKMEMSKLGYSDIHISLPRVYSVSGQDDSIMTGIYVDEKYTMTIVQKNVEFLNVELAFQAKK